MRLRFRAGPLGGLLMVLHALAMLPSAIMGILCVMIVVLTVLGRW